MDEFKIQFDPAKAKVNLRKHKVRMADAEGVFYDEFMLERPDKDHDEERFVSIGNDGMGNILVVAYTYRDPNFIRLISVRKAKPHEIAEYEAR